MNGIALLLLTATLGVEYDWRTLEDGQIEYVLIVEPDLIPSLAEGSEISSSVPAELESVQRLCIRIAQPANAALVPRSETQRSLPATQFRSRIGLRAGDPMTVLWKAKGQPEETNAVRYGWQPTKDGLQQYFVQIDPKFLRTLAPGDEIYTTVSTEAGRVDTFVVFSNAKQLPKVPGKPVNSSLAVGTAPGAALPGSRPPVSPAVGPAATFGAPNPLGPAPLPSAPLAADSNPPAFGPLSTARSTTPPLATSAALDRPAPFPSPNTFGNINDTGSGVNPAANYDQREPAGSFGSSFPNGATRPNLNAPNLNPPSAAPPLTNSTPYTSDGFRNNEGYRGTDGYRGNELRANDPRDQFAQQTDPYRTQPTDPRNDLYPPGNPALPNTNNPYLNPNAPGVRNTTAPLPGAPLSNNGVALPGSVPYRPNVGYAQDSQLQPAAYDNRPPNGSQQADYRPTTQDTQLASRDLNTVRPGTRNDLPLNQAVAAPPAEKPWWPLVFMAFGLFVSIGANFYLGWTAAEFYSRYKLAVERLRTSSRA